MEHKNAIKDTADIIEIITTAVNELHVKKLDMFFLNKLPVVILFVIRHCLREPLPT